MGAGGCVDTQQTQNKAKEWLVGVHNIIVDKNVCGGEMAKTNMTKVGHFRGLNAKVGHFCGYRGYKNVGPS